MIHGASTDPVLVKKISLKIWTLRDEIEAVINARYKDPSNRPPLEDLIKEYKETGDIAGKDGNEEGLKDVSQLDDFGEDEMAKAIAEAEAEEAAKEEEEEEAPAEEAGDDTQSQDDIDALIASGGELPAEEEIPKEVTTEVDPEQKDGKTLVKQRRPIIPEEKMFSGRAILSEIYMNEMFLFSNQSFLEGQSIVIDFLVPKRFLMNAVVTYCRPFNMKSRIISKNRHPFRVGIRFSYLKPGERTILRNFVQSIEPDVEEVVQTAATGGDEGGGDDFDIFDDLD